MAVEDWRGYRYVFLVLTLGWARAKATWGHYCKCWFCLNSGPNGECENCGLLPKPERES